MKAYTCARIIPPFYSSNFYGTYNSVLFSEKATEINYK